MVYIDLAPFEDSVTDSLVAISGISDPAVVQMNIDWVTEQLNAPKVPIAAGLWLGELLDLLVGIASRLNE